MVPTVPRRRLGGSEPEAFATASGTNTFAWTAA